MLVTLFVTVSLGVAVKVLVAVPLGVEVPVEVSVGLGVAVAGEPYVLTSSPEPCAGTTVSTCIMPPDTE